jgi:pimeloyl-ACP methyl ester carboxylesterase
MSAPVWRDEAGPADAPAILLIHGSMDRAAGMLRLSRRLDQRFRMVRYDRRGYGRSKPHDGPFGMDAQVDDALEVLGGRRCVVVGHSYGGNVALALAERAPEAVLGVAVYETPLSWEPWWPGTTAGARAVATQGEPDEAAERFMRRLIGDDRWDALPEGTRRERREEGRAMVGELTDLRATAPWHAGAIEVPVVAGFGEFGSPHHQQGMRHLAATLPDCTVVEVPGCRHDAPHSNAELFRTIVVEPLLARVGLPSPAP